MEIEEIRLSGFKSFADAVLLPLSGGVTVVVGPNGSGKSNIVDGLRWLGGEGSVRRMRGGEMEDLIFGGSGRRLPRVSQEVGLKFVGVSLESVGVLGSEVRERAVSEGEGGVAEVEIVRYLERGKGSHYRANGEGVLKRDVNIFFGDMAFGGSSLSIVGQGMVGEVVRMTGEDCRRMVESSSGLQGLRERYGDAGVKLRGVEENLDRLREHVDLHEEQMRVLREQAKKAKRYEDYSEKIREVEFYILRRRVRVCEEGLGGCMVEEVEAKKGESESERVLGDVRKGNDALREVLELRRRGRDESLLLEQKKGFELRGLEEEEVQVGEGMLRLSRESERNDEDRERESSLCVQARERLEAIGRKKREWEGKRLEGEVREKARKDLECACEEKERCEGEKQRLHREWVEEKVRAEKLGERKEEGKKRVEEQRVQCEELEAECAKLKGEGGGGGEGYEEEKRAWEEKLKGWEAAYEEAKGEGMKRGELYEEGVRSYEERRRVREGELSSVRDRKVNAEVERRTLLGVMKERGGGEDSVLHGIDVDEGYEVMVDKVLGKGVLFPCLEEGEEGTGWRFLGGGKEEISGGIESLLGKVRVPKSLERVLGSVGIVESDEEGEKRQGKLRGGQVLVSREGGMYRWDGYVERGEEGGGEDVLSVRVRCDRLWEMYEDARKEEEACEDVLRREEEVKWEEGEKMKAWRVWHGDELQKLAMKIEETRVKVRACEEGERERKRELSLLRLRRDEKEELLRLMKERLRGEEEAWVDHVKAYEGVGDISVLEKVYREGVILSEGAVKVWEEMREKWWDREREYRMVEEMLGSLVRDEGEWRKGLERSEERLGSLMRRREESEKERLVFEERMPLLLEEKAKVLGEMKEEGERRESAQRAVEEAELEERKREDARREGERVRVEWKEALARVRANKEMWEEKLGEARRFYEEARRGGAKGVWEGVEGESIEECEGRAEALRGKRERLGGINLLAREALGLKEADQEERLVQMEDVRVASEKLRVSQRELEKDASVKFLSIFESINVYFQEHFERVFGGGRASLRLSNTDDILHSGIEIEVEFSGKRVSSLLLLSGGEQALVALCLMFAMFRTHRAPLYVLDEVDAALDDVNVGKFCELMKMCGREWGMRFLVVTHHRLTMAMADRLFGVTMVEKGVSKLVAVDVGEAVEKWSREEGVRG